MSSPQANVRRQICKRSRISACLIESRLIQRLSDHHNDDLISVYAGYRPHPTEFRLHKSILSAKSDWIKERIETKASGGLEPIKISDINLATFDCFVKWAYSGEPPTMGVKVDGWKRNGQDFAIITHHGPDLRGCDGYRNRARSLWMNGLNHQNRLLGRLLDAFIFELITDAPTSDEPLYCSFNAKSMIQKSSRAWKW